MLLTLVSLENKEEKVVYIPGSLHRSVPCRSRRLPYKYIRRKCSCLYCCTVSAIFFTKKDIALQLAVSVTPSITETKFIILFLKKN